LKNIEIALKIKGQGQMSPKANHYHGAFDAIRLHSQIIAT